MSEAAEKVIMNPKAEDGWIYAGSSDNGKDLYVSPVDLTFKTWREAMKDAGDMRRKTGDKTIRLPSPNEMRNIFNNRAKIRDYRADGLTPASIHLSNEKNSHGDIICEEPNGGRSTQSPDRRLSAFLVRECTPGQI